LSIPSDIESYLTPDEKMMKIGKSREWEIYVTNKRVIFKKGGIFGKEIVEASYRHISSIEYKKQSPLGNIVAGLVLIVFGFVSGYYALLEAKKYSPILYEELNTLYAILAFLGFILAFFGIILIVAILFLSPNFKIHIVGRKPLTISGKELEEIIKIIRQYREKVEAEITKRDK